MNAKAKEVFNKVMADKELKERFKKVKTEEEALKLIKELGYDVTPEDFAAKPKDGQEMDMKELEGVSGAGGCGCVGAGGGGGANSIGEFSCLCFLGGTGFYGMLGGGSKPDEAKHGLCVCPFAGAGATNDPEGGEGGC